MSIQDVLERQIAEVDEEIEGLTETKEDLQKSVKELEGYIADLEKNKKVLQGQLTEWIRYQRS